jgi:hypothetical protein
VLVRELDVIDLVVHNLEAAFHAAHDGVGEHLFPSRSEDTFAQIDVVVV